MPETARLPTTDRLLELVDGMAGKTVVVAADLVVDRFITGSPKRISREAPVLILRYEGETIAPGGGANAVANVRALGGVPLALGIVGDDANGAALLECLTSLGVETSGIAVRSSYRTPTKTRILGGGQQSIKQQIVRFDVEDELELGAEELDHWRRSLTAWGPQAGPAILSDYGYGAVSPRLVPFLRQMLGDGSTLLCDSRYRLAEFAGMDGATPNAEEADALLGHHLSDAALDRDGAELLRLLGGSFLLVTRGSRGMSLFEEGQAWHMPVHGTDQVADVTGAGDTVIGTFALAMAAGGSCLEAALLANFAGGVVVMKMGTATLDRDELSTAVRSDPGLLERLRWARC